MMREMCALGARTAPQGARARRALAAVWGAHMKIPKGQLPVSVNARRLRADAARKRRGCGEELSAFLECVAAVEGAWETMEQIASTGGRMKGR